MLLTAIILGIAAAVLLFLFIMQRLEIKNISKQVKDIRSQDTNGLVHSSYGGKTSDELLNEINGLLKEMRASRTTYQRKNHELQQMMTNISHDLRTPLTSAMGYIEMVRNSELPLSEKEREIEIIEKRLQRLEELINSFFEFSKIISGESLPETEEINLVSALEESAVHYYDDYCGQKRSIALDCGAPRIMIVSNRNMLMRIFDNLIGNALKHGTGDLAITVETQENVRIVFENELYDTEMDVSRIFDEFYTTDISRTKGNTGLGLAIAKQFTQMLGGSISAKYDGETFAVALEFPKA